MALVIPFKSKMAKAEIAESLAKDVAKAERKKAMASAPIIDKDAIRGFWKQYPGACKLFGKLIVKWRGSTSTRPGQYGYWAAFTHAEWAELAGMSVPTLKRHLDLLEKRGLIERELGKHGGNRVLSFIRPTTLALKLSDYRPSDFHHLTAGKPTPKPDPAPLPYVLKPAQPSADDDKPKTFEELMAIIGKSVS